MFELLRVVADSSEACSHYYWIDQICINQSHVAERNHTVAKMPDIYARATAVIVWLGDSGDDSDYAMDLLCGKIGKAQRGILRTLVWEDFQRTKRAVHALFTRGYWNRLWILQELKLAKTRLLWCGLKSINIHACVTFRPIVYEFFRESESEIGRAHV